MSAAPAPAVWISPRTAAAVRALGMLARHDAPLSLQALAQRHDMSLANLERLFAALRRAGLVRAARGPGGGYRLARPADAITLADVATATERPAPRTAVPTTEAAVVARLWDVIGDELLHQLRAMTLRQWLDAPKARPAAGPAALPGLDSWLADAAGATHPTPEPSAEWV